MSGRPALIARYAAGHDVVPIRLRIPRSTIARNPALAARAPGHKPAPLSLCGRGRALVRNGPRRRARPGGFIVCDCRGAPVPAPAYRRLQRPPATVKKASVCGPCLRCGLPMSRRHVGTAAGAPCRGMPGRGIAGGPARGSPAMIQFD
ncbi:Uncharacterised protein [Bordetella pertussis]|nr:Uncharacterised protein [Bordetella pertussis]